MSPIKQNFVIAIVAGFFYFFIALICNWHHGFDRSIIPALGHGFFCFTMTFISSNLMGFIFKQFNKLYHRYFGSMVISYIISISLMTLIHLALSTPEIFATVLASALISLPYYIAFPLKLAFDYQSSIDRYSYRNDKNWNREWKIHPTSCPYPLKDFFKVCWLNVYKPSLHKTVDIEMLENKFTLSQPTQHDCLKIVFLGDLMPMYKYRWKLDKHLIHMIQTADYLVCNFEGLIQSRGKVVLAQNQNTNILDDITQYIPAHKVILSVSNNHSADSGLDGLNATIDKLEARGFRVIGKRDTPSVLLNHRVNLVAATQWSNQHHGYLSFLEHSSSHVQEGYINVLYPHWGYELEFFPRQETVQLAKSLLSGFDAIVGHHTHIPGAISQFSIDEKDKLVAFSLGDSSTGLPSRRYRYGMCLSLDIGDEIQAGEWCYTKLIKTDKHELTLSHVDRYDVF